MTELDGREIRTLWSVADVLVPATGLMPALRDVDADGEWLARTLAARPDLVDGLHRALADVTADDVSGSVRAMYDGDRAEFDVLAAVVTGTYYLTPRVRQLIGYPGQARNPPRLDEAAEQLEDVLEQAMNRPSFYRPTPSATPGPVPSALPLPTDRKR
jgi:hypothetical protein